MRAYLVRACCRPAWRRLFRPCLEAFEPRLAPSVNVLTYHNDLARTGDNLQETQLTPANVNTTTFGQLFNTPVDGQIYGQPMILTGVNIPGQGTHDVVFVTTEHDSVYAFDANNGALLWHDNFLNPGAGITTVPSGVTGSADITPEVGITAPPAIDPSSGTLYVVSKTQEVRGDGNHYVQKLHALDIGTGAEKLGGPVLLGDSIANNGPDGGFTDLTPIFVPGTGDSSNGTDVFFNALRENERDNLFLSGGVLYLTFTSHGDTQPYHGWLVGFNPQTLQLESEYCTTPDGTEGAIWMGGGAPAVDANGNVFFATGNGTFDATGGGPQALGPGGGGLGYGSDHPGGGGGIQNSVAVKFDLYSNAGEGTDSTGLYTDGASPTVPAIDMSASGLSLQSQDLMQATLSYNGTTLTETLTDTVTSATFTTSYAVNIPQVVGGSTAYVGFTGGTGGLTSVQDVHTWTLANGPTTVIDHSGGFASNADLSANGSAAFTGGFGEVTDGGGSEAGSFFTNTKVNVSNFTTTFTFRQHDGTAPNMADGMTFTIENAPPGPDYAMSVEKVSPTPGANNELPVLDSFTPFNESPLSGADLDQGSGGVLLLPTQSTGPAHLLVQSSKTGQIFLINRDNMGGFHTGSDNIVQELAPNTVNGGSYDTPAYFNNGSQQLIYYMGQADVLKSFTLANGQLSTNPFAQSSTVFNFPGATPSISANGTQNGIVWVVDTSLNGTGGHPNSGPAVLHAYDATTLQELYNSSQLGTVDQLGAADKFMTPTIANGKVYVATQTGLYVFGSFPVPTAVPADASNLTATASSSSSITLNWTNNATNARDIKILRSLGDKKNFVQIATVSPGATTFTDTNLQPSTAYFYEVVASNALGDSIKPPQANATTLIAPAVLSVTGTGSSEIDLSWTATANSVYQILRSTDGSHFTQINTVAATTTYEDSQLAPGTYYYEVKGVDTDGETALSNIVHATVGQPIGINHAAGFNDSSGLTANGSASFTSSPFTTPTVAQLTDGGFGEASSIFSNQALDVRSFTTTFTFQMYNGTSPFGADGLAFVIQGNSPTALGGGGGGLGYQGINNSVAVYFRAFAGPGVVINGQFYPSSYTGLGQDGNFVNANDVDPANINFNAGTQDSPPDVYSVTLSYSGSTLTETLTDQSTGATFSTSYPGVNIPALVGGNVAYVGFSGGTGGLSLVQQVQTWQYTPTTQNLSPLGPSGLQVANVVAHDAGTSDITLVWTRNSYNETGYQVNRSTDGVHFTPLATLPPNSDTYTDTRLGAGTYYYQVFAFNAQGSSNPSNTDSVIIGAPAAAVTVDHSAGFAGASGLTLNGSATTAGSLLRLTDGGGEASSAFTTSRVGVTNFTTTFTFQMHGGTNPMADGMTFILQAASPTALGGSGGGLGYGSDTPGGPQGIPRSIAIKFDLYSNAGEGTDSTGLFLDGDSPTIAIQPGDSLVDLSSTGIDLHSQDVFQVTLSYSGTTLTETITDTVTHVTFTHAYTVDIGAVLGSNVGYAGFGAGTGGLTTIADVLSWTYQFTTPTKASQAAGHRADPLPPHGVPPLLPGIDNLVLLLAAINPWAPANFNLADELLAIPAFHQLSATQQTLLIQAVDRLLSSSTALQSMVAEAQVEWRYGHHAPLSAATLNQVWSQSNLLELI
jgi:hypothetical protein